MKLALALVLAFATSAYAQVLKIHGNTKAQYDSPADWTLKPDAQCHWVPGDGSPTVDPPHTITHDMAHTHVGVFGPVYAELAGPVTVPVSFKLFHTAGKITQVWAFYAGACGQRNIPITLSGALPVGNPDSGDPVVVNGTITINPSEAIGVCVPKHGWFSVLVNARTVYTNKDQTDTTSTTSYYSMVDPTQPEPPLNEAGIALSGKCQNVSSHSSSVNNVYGIQLVEFRTEVPLAPLTAPVTLHNFSYAYGYDHALPNGAYELDLDPDLHVGLPGTPLAFKANASAGGTSNFDLIDPVVLATSTAPMGYPTGRHKLLFAWVQPTGTAPIVGHDGGIIAPNILLKSLIAFDVSLSSGPPPTTCQDPAATNVGGPLPCTYPIPPPPADRCAANVGQSGIVAIGGVPFKVTVTTTLCAATVVVQ